MHRVLAVGLALAGLLVAEQRAAAPGDQVVVTVGASKLTVGEVERRLRGVPPYQLTQFGATPEQIRKTYVDRVLVPELLFEEEGKRRRLAEAPEVRDRVREILRQTMEQELREGPAAQSAVSADEVKAYYDQNRDRFITPRRLRIWRILVADEALAKKIAAESHGTEGPTKWADLSRKHSLDKATNLRSGDLGFVRPDGTTDTPRVRVEPALFAAADKVKDGELVPEPVKEGDKWAVVWRRGSMAAVTRTLPQEEASIRSILARKKLDDQRNGLLEALKKQHVREVNDELLSYVDVSAFGDVAARQRPGVLPRQRAREGPAPKPGERGLR